MCRLSAGCHKNIHVSADMYDIYIYFLIADDPEWSGVERLVNEGELTQRHA